MPNRTIENSSSKVGNDHTQRLTQDKWGTKRTTPIITTFDHNRKPIQPITQPIFTAVDCVNQKSFQASFLSKLLNMIANLLSIAIDCATNSVSDSKHLKETKDIKQTALYDLSTIVITNMDKKNSECHQALKGFIMRAAIPREGGWKTTLKFGNTSSLNKFKNYVLCDGITQGISEDDFQKFQQEAEQFYSHPDEEISAMRDKVNLLKDKTSGNSFWSSKKQQDKHNCYSRKAEEYLNDYIAAKFSANESLCSHYRTQFYTKYEALMSERTNNTKTAPTPGI